MVNQAPTHLMLCLHAGLQLRVAKSWYACETSIKGWGHLKIVPDIPDALTPGHTTTSRPPWAPCGAALHLTASCEASSYLRRLHWALMGFFLSSCQKPRTAWACLHSIKVGRCCWHHSATASWTCEIKPPHCVDTSPQSLLACCGIVRTASTWEISPEDPRKYAEGVLRCKWVNQLWVVCRHPLEPEQGCPCASYQMCAVLASLALLQHPPSHPVVVVVQCWCACGTSC
jgi:hypothetical protein